MARPSKKSAAAASAAAADSRIAAQLAESVRIEAAYSAALASPRSALGLGLCGLPSTKRMTFQDALFVMNEEGMDTVTSDGTRKRVHLTDTQLVLCNKVEHPWCTGKMDESIVRGMRRLYNQGRHSKAAATPNTPVTAWSGDGVTPATFRIRRAKTATA